MNREQVAAAKSFSKQWGRVLGAVSTSGVNCQLVNKLDNNQGHTKITPLKINVRWEGMNELITRWEDIMPKGWFSLNNFYN